MTAEDKTFETIGAPSPSAWVPWAIATAICFTVCNAAIAEITQTAGAECLFYFASGSIVTGVAYTIIDSKNNYSKTHKLWNDQNIIVDGKFRVSNFIGFLAYCCNYFLI